MLLARRCTIGARCFVFVHAVEGYGRPLNRTITSSQRKPRAAAAQFTFEKYEQAGWPRGLLRGAMRGRRAAQPDAQTHAHCPGHRPKMAGGASKEVR